MIFEVTLERMIVFFIIFSVGILAGKLKIIRKEYMPHLARLITMIFLPVMIFYSTYANCTRQAIVGNWIMIVLTAGFYALISLITFLLAKLLAIPHDKDRVFQMCFIFGNTGFVGIPLLVAVFPQNGLVYMMMFTIIDQLVFWTYGVWLSTARDNDVGSFDPRVLITPNTVAILLGVLFVFLEIPLPDLIDTSLEIIDQATSALCMMYLGGLACFSRVLPILKRPELYVGIGVKMIALPVILGKLLLLTQLFSSEMVYALVIIMALPVMTVVPMVVAEHGHESEYATGITVVTLIVSIVTIPLVVFLL